jgi:mRNA-degrading endonuclease RelE of RelBE toxin-antitoxin system
MGQKRMPKYFLFFHRKAEKSLAGLDERTKQRLLEDIGCLASFTGLKSHLDIVKMQGHEDYCRLRSGKVRVVFFVDHASKRIIILKVEKRENVYE